GLPTGMSDASSASVGTASVSTASVRTAASDPDARIVLSRDCGVWIARPDGSDAVNLTAGADACVILPSLSRTGRYVAYQIGAGSGSEVWVHDRESGTSAPLPGLIGGGMVDFSPTSDTLAFARFDPAIGAANI